MSHVELDKDEIVLVDNGIEVVSGQDDNIAVSEDGRDDNDGQGQEQGSNLLHGFYSIT